MEELIAKIYEFNTGLPNDLAEIKYELMKESLFRFFRATCHIFFELWSQEASGINAPNAWICGDLHLENFGSYKGQTRWSILI